jgi:hypothetical protein
MVESSLIWQDLEVLPYHHNSKVSVKTLPFERKGSIVKGKQLKATCKYYDNEYALEDEIIKEK